MITFIGATARNAFRKMQASRTVKPFLKPSSMSTITFDLPSLSPGKHLKIRKRA